MHLRNLVGLGKYLLAFGLLAWVVSKNWALPDRQGLEYIWQRHIQGTHPIHWGFLLSAFLLYCAALLLTLFRWHVLVRAQDLPFRIPDALRMGLIGLFFNTFLPGSVGGDVVKAAALAREQSRRTVAVATVIMDRVVGLWALVWLLALLGACFWLGGALEGDGGAQSKLIVLASVITLAVSGATWLLLGWLPLDWSRRFAARLDRVPKVGAVTAEFCRAIWMYRCRQRSVALALLLSWVSFAGFILSYYFSVLSLLDGDTAVPIPTLVQHFLLVPIGLVIAAIPLFPGGAGISELGFGALYSWLGYSEASGVLGSLVQRVLTWVIGLLGYGVYLRMRGRLVTPTAKEVSERKFVNPPEALHDPYRLPGECVVNQA
jgi:uncharacterized protein (TIRG00374 family)